MTALPDAALSEVARFESREDATFAWSVLHRRKVPAVLRGAEATPSGGDETPVALLVPSEDREHAIRILTVMSPDGGDPLAAMDRWHASSCPRCGAVEYLVTPETRAVALVDLVTDIPLSEYIRMRRRCRACRYTS